MKKKRILPTLLCIAGAAALLHHAAPVADGVRSGLLSCANILIPSLFPFMILASLITGSAAGESLSRAVSFLTRPLGLPKHLGSVLLMSFLGGFPVGARMLSAMYREHELDKDTVERALCCCVNAGPSFVISAVGMGMLGNLHAGVLLLCAQVLSSLFICIFAFRGQPKHAALPAQKKPVRQDVFVGAVRDASGGILSVCGFVVAFSAITALLRAVGALQGAAALFGALMPAVGAAFFEALFTGALEVTNGCIAAAALGGFWGYALCAFLVSFSSLSIMAQVRACFPDDLPVNFSKFYRSRILHGALTTLFACIFWKLMPLWSLPAAAMQSAPVMRANPNMIVSSGCLLAMCTLLVLQKPGKNRAR